MTVKLLIEKLKSFPLDYQVHIVHYDGWLDDNPIEIIRQDNLDGGEIVVTIETGK